MRRRIQNQTHGDFRKRIKRVDPVYYRWGERGAAKDITAKRPIGSVLMGFAWAYLVISVSSNRALIESSLQQGNLSTQHHSYILMGLAGLLMASIVMLAIHLFRFFMARGGKKQNSGALLVGVLGALVLVYTPASVWNTGFGMMDVNSQKLLLTASSTVSDAIPGVDFGSVAFVSSQGR